MFVQNGDPVLVVKNIPVETKDYMTRVVLLHPVYVGSLMGVNYCSGTFYFRRGDTRSGLTMAVAEINTGTSHSRDTYCIIHKSLDSENMLSLCTLMYEGVKYMAVCQRSTPGLQNLQFIGFYKSQAASSTHLKVIQFPPSEESNYSLVTLSIKG